MTERSSKWRADMALLAVAVIWGLNFPIMKAALTDLYPFAFNSLRITLSAAVLGLWHLRERGTALRLHLIVRSGRLR